MMMRVVFLAVFLFLAPLRASAGYVGLNGLAGMNPRFPCDDYLNAVGAAQYPLFTVLWDSSFGSDKACLARFLQSNASRPHAVLIYLENGNARHDKTLEHGDFFPQVSKKVWNALITMRHPIVLQAFADRLDAITAFMTANGSVNTQVIIVPGLEDCYDSKAWAVLSLFVKERTWYTVARNPSTGSKERGHADFKETHDRSKKCGPETQIANLDGSILSKSETTKWLKSRQGCFVSVGYVPEIQGRGKGGSFKGGRFNRTFTVPKGWDVVLSNF